MKKLYYVVADEVYHHDSMMFADPDWVLFNGTEDECKQFIVDYKMQQQFAKEQEDGLAHQERWELYEEMEELDPRDYDRIDDFGDSIS